MIHVLYHRDAEVRRRLFDLVDEASRPILVCSAHASPGVDVRQREPVRTFEGFAGDLVDVIVVVDEGLVEGMWRDPVGDLCSTVFASKAEASAAAAGYLFLRGRRPLGVVRKSTGDPLKDLHELCDFARASFDPERTPPPRTRPRVERAGRRRARPPPMPPGIDDPFAVLGIPPTVTLEEAKAAWRSLVAKYHPDKVAHLAEEFRELAERRTREINGAFDEVERQLRRA